VSFCIVPTREGLPIELASNASDDSDFGGGDDVESEEEDPSSADPYPLEGKYKNEKDRQMCVGSGFKVLEPLNSPMYSGCSH
jgi:hypothetical protein